MGSGGQESNRHRQLDVRAIPTWERHARVHEAFAGLDAGASLLLISDHEPRPLRLEFLRSYPDGFVWSQRHIGMGRWEVELRKCVSAPVVDGHELDAFLRCCAVFSDTRAQTLSKVARSARVRLAARGTTIAEQDAQWPYLGLVRSGVVSTVMGSSSGRDQHLFHALPNDTFGAVETLDGGRTVARFVATADSEIVLIPRGIVVTAMVSDFSFAAALGAICAQRVRAIAELLSAHVTQPAIARIAAALLPYASPQAGLAPSLEPLRRMTHAHLAAIAGTAKEVAARAVAELEESGVIERAGGRIACIDRSKLQAVVDRGLLGR